MRNKLSFFLVNKMLIKGGLRMEGGERNRANKVGERWRNMNI